MQDLGSTPPYQLRLCAYADLQLDELYTLLQFRQEVFIVEQQCPYLDADGRDQAAWHMWLLDGQGVMQAYCRLLPEGVSYVGYTSLGRVISRGSSRRQGWGRQLTQSALEALDRLWPAYPVKISAQCYLEGFYASFGFQSVGEPYLEDDIPHQAMIRPATTG